MSTHVRPAGRWSVALLTGALSLCSTLDASAQTNWRFVPQDVIPMGAAPTALLSKDVTGDGLPDLVVANPDEDTITLRVGLAWGTFSDPLVFPVGDMPLGIAAGDVNGDGFADLLVGVRSPALSSVYTLSILLGTGDSEVFHRQPDLLLSAGTTLATQVRNLALADYTGDGPLDLVVGWELIFGPTGRPEQVSIHTGNGDGTFASGQILVSSSGSLLGDSPAVEFADLNADGHPDAIGTAGPLIALRSPFGLAYQSGPSLGNTSSVASGDFNTDGVVDVAIGHHAPTGVTGGIEILYSAGTSSRNLVKAVGVGDYIGLMSSDMDGDGAMDLVALKPTGVIAILQSNPLVGFESSALDVGAPTTSFGVSDFNGDGRADLAATTAGGVVVLLQRAPISPVLVDTLETQVSDLQQEIVAKDATIGNLQTQVGDLITDNLELEDLIDQLTADLGAANETIAAQQTTIGNLNSQIAVLTSERNSLAAENSALQGQLSTANGTIATQQTTIGNLQTQLAAANQAVASLTAQLANATADFTAQIAILQQALQTALADTSFVIPGATPQAQIQNLVTAIDGLNPGQKLALYKNLGGRKR